jgi:predicted Rossmann fold nucleotide-binding protein DprA/Smf involved in DNA uptake
VSPRGERWFDKEAGPVVRLYALTRGRARPAGVVLDVVDVVGAAEPLAAHAPWLPPEHRRLLELCGTPIAVADLASETGLPLGVVQILLSDLHEQGLVSIVGPAKGHTEDENVLRKVLDGLRAL